MMLYFQAGSGTVEGEFLPPFSSEPDIFEMQERGEGIIDGMNVA